jgi:hypothetical protein
VIAEAYQEDRVLTPSKPLSVQKTDGYRNEDRWWVSRRKRVSALSDGASVSFDSATWARILVRRYARNPRFNRVWLDGAIAEFAKLYDRDNLPWMQQAAFDRGSFASLLGVTHLGDGRIRVLAIGDSIAVLCNGDRVLSSFPYTLPEQFDQRPQLLSTNPAENVFLDGLECDEISNIWNLDEYERPSLLCMTDALGQWVLTHREQEPSPVARLRQIRSCRAFKRFIATERAAGRMRRDDTTLLAYWQCAVV